MNCRLPHHSPALLRRRIRKDILFLEQNPECVNRDTNYGLFQSYGLRLRELKELFEATTLGELVDTCAAARPDAVLLESPVDAVDADPDAAPPVTTEKHNETEIRSGPESRRVVLRSGAQGQYMERVQGSDAQDVLQKARLKSSWKNAPKLAKSDTSLKYHPGSADPKIPNVLTPNKTEFERSQKTDNNNFFQTKTRKSRSVCRERTECVWRAGAPLRSYALDSADGHHGSGGVRLGYTIENTAAGSRWKK